MNFRRPVSVRVQRSPANVFRLMFQWVEPCFEKVVQAHPAEGPQFMCTCLVSWNEYFVTA